MGEPGILLPSVEDICHVMAAPEYPYFETWSRRAPLPAWLTAEELPQEAAESIRSFNLPQLTEDFAARQAGGEEPRSYTAQQIEPARSSNSSQRSNSSSQRSESTVRGPARSVAASVRSMSFSQLTRSSSSRGSFFFNPEQN